MNRSTVAIIAVATLLLGSGVSGILFVKPALEEQEKLKKNKADLSGQKSSLETQVATLEAQVKQQAMGTISYFDLRTVPNQRREMEAKTVETLASLTEIFNDNKIDVQVLEPKGETQGLSKPVPTPAVSAAPAAGASPGAPAPTPTPAPTGTPAGPPTEPPVQLTHKAFTFSVRGEYPNLVRALSEIQGLPKAISINQYDVELVQKPGDKAAKPPEPGDPVISPSMLELDFELSITYLMAGGLPAGGPAAAPGAPAAPGAAPSAKPISLELLHWATNWLGEPAYAAELVTDVARPAKAPAHPRFEVTGVSSVGGDLVLRTRRGVPRYRFSGTASRLVIELEETRVAEAAAFAARVPGVRAVSARPSTSDPNAVVIVVETDGTRFVPAYQGTQLKVRRLSPLSAREQAATSQPAQSAAAAARSTSAQRAVAPKSTLHPAFQVQGGSAAAAQPVPPAKGQKAAKADPTLVVRRVAPAARPEVADAETWSSLAERAAAEWASTQGGDPEAFTPPVGTPVEKPAAKLAAPTQAAKLAAPVPAVKAAEHAAARLVAKPSAQRAAKPVSKPAAVPATDALVRPVARPVATPLEQPVVQAAARFAENRDQRPATVAAAAPTTRMRGVAFEDGALVVRTEGPAPSFKVVGGDRRSIILELDQTRLPGAGRLFAVGQAGVKQVRAALYDNHPPRVRLVVDTDGTIAVHPVVGPDGVLRLRLADRPGISSREVRLASAATSAIITTTKENPITRNPASVRRQEPLQTVKPRPKPKPRPVLERQRVAHRVVRGPAARAAVQRAQAHPARPHLPVLSATRPVPTATPTPMARPSSMARGTAPAQAAKPAAAGQPAPRTVAVPTPMPTPVPTPPGPSLTRSLSTTYSFPIDREKTTGRQNPFSPLSRSKGQPDHKGVVPPPVPGKPALPGRALPAMPLPGAAGPAGVPGLPKAPSGAAGGYVLGGVLVGGGGPPMALVNVDGKAYTVGLNETLPGNARVTAIKVDHVILSADGRSIRLDLKR